LTVDWRSESGQLGATAKDFGRAELPVPRLLG
jgi:hypothetical protein